MIYLITSIICSALISILMRYSESKSQSPAGMFIANYFTCIVLSCLYLTNINPFSHEKGMGITIGLGIVSGFLYLAGFLLLNQNIKKNGVVLASIFMKLGVIIPILFAIIFFHEVPGLSQIIGIVIAILAIIVINYDKNESVKSGSQLLLIILFINSGITDSMANTFDKIGNLSLKDNYLLFTFGFAFICSIVLYFVQKKKLCKWDLIFGVIIGIPNYYASRFLLLSLNEVPAVVVYPVYSVATIILITLAGVFLFRERLSKQKIIGLALVLAAIALINL